MLKMDGFELDKSKLTIRALELDNSAFSAVELDHSTLRACARELDNYGWGALEVDRSKIGNMNAIHRSYTTLNE